MLCGNMDFNKEIKSLLVDERGWKEGNNKQAGSFALEKAFVG